MELVIILLETTYATVNKDGMAKTVKRVKRTWIVVKSTLKNFWLKRLKKLNISDVFFFVFASKITKLNCKFGCFNHIVCTVATLICLQYSDWESERVTDPLSLLDVNECLANPCQNGGSCTNSIGSYSCNCTREWTGRNCNEGKFLIILCILTWLI